jgi:hypothetical protein
MTHPGGSLPYPSPEELEHATWFKATVSNGRHRLRRSRAPCHLDRDARLEEPGRPGALLHATRMGVLPRRARAGEFDRP